MNILVINHYAGAPSLGMEYRQYYLAREWQRSGHNVLIVTASFTHLRSTQFKMLNKLEKKVVENINYLVIKTPSYDGNDYKRVLNITSFIITLKRNWKKISQEFEPDAVITSSTYCFDIYSSKKIANFAKAKLVFEVHDLWPLSPMELGGYSKWHPFIYSMQVAENYAYQNADKVISILPKTLQYMVEHGLEKDKFVHVPNGICVEEWDVNHQLPDEIDELLTRLKSNNNKLIGYAGNHGIANALNHLIDAMKYFESENVVLLLIGKGQEKENLINKVVKMNLKNVHFISALPKNIIPALLDKFDILYVGLQNQPVFRFGISPNKLIDYMMAGKPIIQAIKAGNDMVKEVGCGISVEPENTTEIVKSIRFLLSQPDKKLKEMGERGKKHCMKNHDYKVLARNFLSALS
jgi:glycosyltransferase involved in cell wall biosynthesis